MGEAEEAAGAETVQVERRLKLLLLERFLEEIGEVFGRLREKIGEFNRGGSTSQGWAVAVGQSAWPGASLCSESLFRESVLPRWLMLTLDLQTSPSCCRS